ncbi:MAG: immunoglobulin domain-containing protein [Balneolales bacterium]|nr:immunoglobulin domain-containing protein [Balneolales bacterium]
MLSPQSCTTGKSFSILFALLTSLVLLSILPQPSQGQYITEPAGFIHPVHRGHSLTASLPGRGRANLCSADFILTDSTAVRALRNYHAQKELMGRQDIVPDILSDFGLGDERDFRVRNITNNTWRSVTFTLRGLGSSVRIWVENDEFAPDQVNQDVVDQLLLVMENQTPHLSVDPGSGILQIGETFLGDRPDIDGSGILNILITDVIDGWEPGGTSGTVAGFFDPVDLDPSNSNSNRTDIIYLNSRPLIYLDGNVNIIAPQSVAAHELQHLIHANYRFLDIFQNEGQSEWTELLTGYTGRNPNYLNNPLEIDQFLYSWRRGSTDVLLDYQRASMLHSYIAQRLGVESAGAITRSSSGRFGAYEQAASAAGLDFRDILMDFHIANYVNNNAISDGRFGYEDIRRRANRVSFPTIQYVSGETQGNGSRSVVYGGAEYIEWVGAENFNLSISGDNTVRFALISYISGSNVAPEIQYIGAGNHVLDGSFERIVLVASAVESGSQQNNTNTQPTAYPYSWTSSWNTLPIVTTTLTYAGQPAAFAELPGTPGRPDREGIKRLAKRFTPEFNSRIDEVLFTVNGRDSSLIGSDNLIVTFNRQTGGTNFRPGAEIGRTVVPISQLRRGENRIDVQAGQWIMNAGLSYYIIFEVEAPTSRVEFLLDAGSTDQNNPNYFPVRTQLYIEPPTVDNPVWANYSQRNNLVASIRLTSEYTGPVDAPVIVSQPTSQVTSIGRTTTFSVEATGTPQPQFQWFKDEQPLYGEISSTLEIEDTQPENEGIYTVRVSNPGGALLSEPALLSISFDDYVVEQNFPNPVRGQTTIRFILPEESSVAIDLFDIQGRRVARLLPEEVREAGRHEITADLSRLSSGVYLYQMRASATGNSRTHSKNGTLIRIR